ncbi:uncharacterized protein LOC117123150 [Anneissia japonica]|uniref:uncharacterized protein LOC117123150 n=1 Tax=Anneissia japonica TaxID=1529436 RepID=UPI0014255BA6|nr:uncharacterized protein LOC117123150 [Anneissia japonica]
MEENIGLTTEDIAGIVKNAIGGVKEYIDDAIKIHKTETQKIKMAAKVKFRFISNQAQFEFNSELLDWVEKASDSLGKADAVDKVGADLNEIKKLLHRRNKLIRIADKSEGGWSVVDEYLSDELASDSDDEKRIRNAQLRAGRRKRFKAQALARKRSATQVHPSPERGELAGGSGGFASNFRRFNAGRGMFGFGGRRVPQPEDICLGCGQRGHWRFQCDQQRNRAAPASAPFPSSAQQQPRNQ